MTEQIPIEAVINELEETFRFVTETIRDGRDGWRLELVRRRRKLSALVSQIATSLYEIESDKQLPEQEKLALRAKLADFRSALAMHQASYPVVSIERETREYLASFERIRSASAELCRYTRRVVPFG